MAQLHLQKKVAVLGLGITGLASVNFLLAQGYAVSVFDTRQAPPGEDKLAPDVELIKGPLCGESLSAFTLIVSSPGIALATPALQFAIQFGCEVIGDIELFARMLKTKAYQHAKCVTITGSNGKSTVTSLLGEMAINSGVKVAVGGNIGIPALDLLSPDIDLYILELSSFQLETTYSLNADIATILNLSEDHLDRYDSYQHYIDTKHRIYEQAKIVLFNSEDSLTFVRDEMKMAKSFAFHDADYHIISDTNNSHYLTKGEQKLLAVTQLKLSGKHNWLNALAAIALGDAVDLKLQAMLTTLTTYTGLEHRCEFVAQHLGVRWINDSKATNIGATQAALQGLSETISGEVHLILGGEGKGADFTDLSPFLTQVKGTICCFGADAIKINAANPQSIIVADLSAAIIEIASTVNAGDLVILSPACASLDMYPNFMARGEHFKTLVNHLILGEK
ncbi:UDP-N-acetylmuramoyl-L-alanine--D-glutamate ligase [Psychromonas sp. Urea-02u-13]|uniref:UDP-N-acetylmuramoyl-L-alanine--D-glutamate ligase n=1 Tax=Psychromonas sp. Urea-02u-13 TaxID=2058326 RepID=UPI000C323752|nr:UDP-N-acetylmuramoyl-L-alanine--D-glutamate ligase [Psychromonas sp. Urea-02u-13]PKG39631.1 UDP-N-acetylmuramoyl-L-alanine--D-glutamate ligase [Psychromonas sp. Urea-02u-13]